MTFKINYASIVNGNNEASLPYLRGSSPTRSLTGLETKVSKNYVARRIEKGESIMNWILYIIADIIMLCVFGFGLYLLGRIYIPKYAEDDTFFSSPKLGRVKARRRSGRIIGFFGNLKGKGKQVNKDTGKIEDGEETPPTGLWWEHFGVRFIGLDDVYQYKIVKEMVETKKDEFQYVEEPASSIYLEGAYSLTILLYSKEGVLFKVKLQCKTTTVDAAKALSLPISWTVPMFMQVIAANRDHFGLRGASELISAQNEGGKIKIAGKDIENSGYAELIKSLNDDKNGNIALKDLCGQHLDSVNIVDIDFANEKDRDAFLAPFVAEQQAQKAIKDATAAAEVLKIKTAADLQSANDIAAAMKVKGNAEIDIYKGKTAAFGGDSKSAAQVIVAEKRGPMDKVITFVDGNTNHGVNINAGGK